MMGLDDDRAVVGEQPSDDGLFAGPGAGGHLCAVDWRSTPLGLVDRWSPALRQAVRDLRRAPLPAVLYWGRQHLPIYNAAYLPLVGGRHPLVLGQPLGLVWPELNERLAPALAEVWTSGRGRLVEHVRLCSVVGGDPRERHFTHALTPIDDGEATAGVLCSLFETTAGDSRQRYLLAFNDALRPLASPIAIQFEAMRMLGERLGVMRTLYAEIDEVAGSYVIHRDWCAPGVPSLAGRLPIADFGPELFESLRTGRPVVVKDVAEMPAKGAAAVINIHVHAWIAVALVKEGRPVVALSIHSAAPRAWTEDEVALVRETAERTWDAVERARAEQALKESRAVVMRANQAKDEFLAMLGHELRNPLTPILAALDLMRMGGRKAHASERAIIERQAGHLARLVDDLLDVTQITRGMVTLVRQPIALDAVVARALESVSPVLESKGHRLAVDVAANLVVDADLERLVQVVCNLLTNAAKYTEDRGCIEITGRRERDQVVLVVRDDGHGIDGELLPHVFDLFRQGRQNAARSFGGLGLGLAIVRNLVALHGGTVCAASDGPGQGSTFTVHLPAAVRQLQPRPTPAAAAVPHIAPQRIVVVDDNRDIADLIARLLRGSGHEVVVAYDGPAGLRAVRSFGPTLALLDIGLPEMDGYQLARRLKAEPALRRIPLIALTGYGQTADRTRARRAGFARHLTKPITFETLVEVIDDLTKPAPLTRSGRPKARAPRA